MRVKDIKVQGPRIKMMSSPLVSMETLYRSETDETEDTINLPIQDNLVSSKSRQMPTNPHKSSYPIRDTISPKKFVVMGDQDFPEDIYPTKTTQYIYSNKLNQEQEYSISLDNLNAHRHSSKLELEFISDSLTPINQFSAQNYLDFSKSSSLLNNESINTMHAEQDHTIVDQKAKIPTSKAIRIALQEVIRSIVETSDHWPIKVGDFQKNVILTTLDRAAFKGHFPGIENVVSTLRLNIDLLPPQCIEYITELEIQLKQLSYLESTKNKSSINQENHNKGPITPKSFTDFDQGIKKSTYGLVDTSKSNTSFKQKNIQLSYKDVKSQKNIFLNKTEKDNIENEYKKAVNQIPKKRIKHFPDLETYTQLILNEVIHSCQILEKVESINNNLFRHISKKSNKQ